ncbi:MAG: FAD-dependent oxidoreductase [Thermoplasmata archaeon]|nr:MAG: FAD-dependent oxidoreductase [Thermoplasmata archaeon]
MTEIVLTINGEEIRSEEGKTILQAALDADIYIPSLCAHPNLPPLKDYPLSEKIYHLDKQFVNEGGEFEEGCSLCLVDVGGELKRACTTTISQGLVVKTDSDELNELRKANLSKILSDHPHVCLTCAQTEGCSRTQCSANVPDNEKCCILLGNCELEKVADYVGISPETPKYVPKELPKGDSEPLFVRDYNLCIGCSRCVRACNDLRGVKALGMVINSGNTIVGTTEPTLKESGCKFCGACVEVCPTGALIDKTTSAPYDRIWNLSPCSSSCPVNIDIPQYTRLIANGKPEEALAVIREKVPFPRVLGRICMHPCESSCRRSELTDPIAICALKRYASELDKGIWKKVEGTLHSEPTGKKVAVIGSGPAGMTAAFYLAKKGHAVTVFESASMPGGMLSTTIPLYRLPKEILDADLQEILEAGDIELRTGEALGKEFTFTELQSGGFNAIFIAVGLQYSRELDIEGIQAENVIQGLEFLHDVRSGERTEIGKKVIVIGGGNVAVDVARTARRMGAEKIDLVCLETREEMPAHEWEISDAEAEDVEVHCSWGPFKILTGDNKVTGIELKRCTCVFDSSGKFCPTYDESQTTKLDADTIIVAIGQSPDLSFIDESLKSLINDNNAFKINLDNLQTDLDGVFAGGDIVKIPGTVIDAIQMGRTAAEHIDKYLGGEGNIAESLVTHEEASQFIGRQDGFFDLVRIAPNTIPQDARVSTLDEVELTYDEAAAKSEASRCLQCDLRLKFKPVPLPPELYIALTDENISTVPESEGVIQLLDETKSVITIKGAMNMREELKSQQQANESAKYFIYEADPMYTQRESELLQQYLQKHGCMPGGGSDELDDLF